MFCRQMPCLYRIVYSYARTGFFFVCVVAGGRTSNYARVPIFRYMEVGRHRGMLASEYIRISSNSYEKVLTFKYLGSNDQGLDFDDLKIL